MSRVYEDGLLKKLVSGNTKIEYNYNFINRKIDTIWLNGAIEKGYTYSNGDKTVQVFDRDMKIISSTTKDDFGNIVEIKKGDTVIESNVYEKGLIKTSTKNAIRSTYNYDENVPERLASITYSNAVSKTFTYDEWGNVTTKNYKENNKDNITTYTYSNDSKKKLTSVNLNNEYIISPQTDIHSRNVGKKFETANGVKIDEESITYAKFGDHATSLPSSIKFWNKTTQSFKDKLDYKYDSMGNIISITQNGKLLSKYTYDKLNRLVREDNTAFGKTYLFEYDNTGNITSKRTCPFTLEKKENISVFDEENTFSYIGDVLYGKDDVTCVNEHGRPTVYLGNAITYKEDGLISSYKGINFLYDTCGKRQVKGSITFSYNNDGLLTKQFNGISFIYDHTSSLIGIKNGTTPYFFRKNIQGDIISILDNTGEVVVRYVYDAWGNHKAYAVNGSECVEVYDNVRGIATGYTNHIANLNPIRYRGYYFDVETGLYYLQTRYYDPQVGRFISPDSIDYLDPNSINGLNLYAYCNNNPIMYSDPTGHFGILTAIVAIVAAILIGAHAENMHTIENLRPTIQESYTIDEAQREILQILQNENPSFTASDVEIDKKTYNLHIENSYLIKDKKVRLHIAMIYKNTYKDGKRITNRSAYDLAAEWVGHNIVTEVILKTKGTIYDRVANVDLDTKLFNNSLWYVPYATIILSILGLV